MPSNSSVLFIYLFMKRSRRTYFVWEKFVCEIGMISIQVSIHIKIDDVYGKLSFLSVLYYVIFFGFLIIYSWCMYMITAKHKNFKKIENTIKKKD